MRPMDKEVADVLRDKALHKWKWRNPFIVAGLVFLHPLGMLLSSIPTFFVYFFLWTLMFVYWPNRPLGTGILLAAVFAFYAYTNTRFQNSCIEKWKYGLKGTGLENPKKIKH